MASDPLEDMLELSTKDRRLICFVTKEKLTTIHIVRDADTDEKTIPGSPVTVMEIEGKRKSVLSFRITKHVALALHTFLDQPEVQQFLSSDAESLSEDEKGLILQRILAHIDKPESE